MYYAWNFPGNDPRKLFLKSKEIVKCFSVTKFIYTCVYHLNFPVLYHRLQLRIVISSSVSTNIYSVLNHFILIGQNFLLSLDQVNLESHSLFVQNKKRCMR